MLHCIVTIVFIIVLSCYFYLLVDNMIYALVDYVYYDITDYLLVKTLTKLSILLSNFTIVVAIVSRDCCYVCSNSEFTDFSNF